MLLNLLEIVHYSDVYRRSWCHWWRNLHQVSL